MSSTNARGRWGENRAALEYRRAGFEVIDRNWSCRRGEIDLILRRGDLLVFCEVKARARASHGGPAAAVGAAKQDRIRSAALEWLDEHRSGCTSIRFDVVTVTGVTVDRIEGAF
ncbi:MAG: YraN family protein [Ilumatobacteraceae bacterium]|nr:YraN family protein [Actinomycetota bacterium]